MKVTYYTSEEMAKAKLGGFKKKKPKKPKSRTERALMSYLGKYNSWVMELKKKSKEGAKLYALRQAVIKCK